MDREIYLKLKMCQGCLELLAPLSTGKPQDYDKRIEKLLNHIKKKHGTEVICVVDIQTGTDMRLMYDKFQVDASEQLGETDESKDSTE